MTADASRAVPGGTIALNAATVEEASELLSRCCGSTRWVEAMVARRPFASSGELHAAALEAWYGLARADHLEAFAHHPRIGDDVAKLRERFAPTAELSAKEQALVAGADEATLVALRDGNVAYEARFGHVFLVCATGKSAAEILALLNARMHADAETELEVAAAEQAKITRLRLEKVTL